MRFFILRLGIVFLIAPAFMLADEPKIDSSIFGGLEARSIGPAAMGGRISAIDAIAGNPSTIYVGAASGGVWKSTDGGTTFKPVFDEHPQSIGAIAIDPVKTDTIWVGTGESCVRNSVSVGTGVYKSIDRGDSWKLVGLADTEHIAKIVVDPKKNDTVYVCATGHAWNANEERGVFKTTDGGTTWNRILHVDSNTGCSDLSIDPQEPRILFAGMWDFRRQPDFFRSGGKASGVYRSLDGGTNWTRLTEGLPKGDIGRVAVAVAPSRASVVYANVEAAETALYRSDDLGEHWTQVNDSFNIQVRPFYFSHLAVDPNDFNRVYKPSLSLGISTDGGKSFSGPFYGGGGVHGDHHAIWINPKDPFELLLGTDGGLYASRDRGTRWRYLNNLPVSQFYHVGVDMDRPYNVYGGLQDNGSWMAPSVNSGGIANRHWRNLGGGDGFHVVPDPSDSEIVFLEWQGGNIVRVNRSTGETKEIKPFPREGEPEYRFNWNTPIHASRKNPGTLYLGAQFVFRSTDKGESWQRISPDLTTNDKSKQRQLDSGGLSRDNSSAENYTTIITISESPIDPNIIWVGTDDGNVQVTRDGGKSWNNVIANRKGVPARTWVSGIDASHHDPGTAYVTFDGHRTGDMKTWVYRTREFGTTWEPLTSDALRGHAQVIREDLVNRDLLFLGTEMGLFISLDGGRSWAQFKEKLPPVPVNDIAIHSREGDVVLGTHGRGIFIIDDITPLRALTTQTLDSEVVMLPSRPSIMTILAGEQRADGDAEFSSGGVSEVASITYYLKKRHIFGESKVEIYDAAGKLVSTLPAGKRKGINRVEWPMRLKGPKMPPANSIVMSGGAFVGPRVPEGTYTVKYLKGKETYTSQVELKADPRVNHSKDDRALQQKTVMSLYDMLDRLTLLTDRVVDLREQAKSRAEDRGAPMSELTAFGARLDQIHKKLVATREGGWLSGEEQIREKLGALYGAVNTYDGKPTASQIGQSSMLESQLRAVEESFEALIRSELQAINSRLERKNLKPLVLLTREEWEKRQSEGGKA